MHNRQRRWIVALVLYLAIIGLILWLAYRGQIPAIIAQVPYYDKFAHALLMGALGYLMHRAMDRRTLRIGPLALPLGFLLATSLIFMEELAQFWSPFRNSSPIDFAADLLGLAVWWITDRVLEGHVAMAAGHKIETKELS